MAKDFYKILGIKKEATDKDIKKAYRKLSLKYHPDKQAGKSENEKKKAEEKMVEINEAYEVLSDKNKKAQYDRFGSVDNNRSDFSDVDVDMDEIFRMMGQNPFFKMHGGNFHQENMKETGQSMKMKIPITLENIYNGCKKKVKFNRYVRCAVCHGAGGIGIKTCEHCHGTGTFVQVVQNQFGYSQTISQCPYCKGTGKIVDKVCSSCNGSGFKLSSNTVEVDFPAGIPNGFAIKYKEQGSESKSIDGINGDFYAVADYQYDTQKYQIDGLDVYEILPVPYYDLILGTILTVKLPNNVVRKIKIDPYTKSQKIITLIGDGLININNGTKGNYNFIIDYKIPEKLSKKEKSLLEELKILGSKN